MMEPESERTILITRVEDLWSPHVGELVAAVIDDDDARDVWREDLLDTLSWAYSKCGSEVAAFALSDVLAHYEAIFGCRIEPDLLQRHFIDGEFHLEKLDWHLVFPTVADAVRFKLTYSEWLP